MWKIVIQKILSDKQWGSKYQASQDFEWSKAIRLAIDQYSSNGLNT